MQDLKLFIKKSILLFKPTSVKILFVFLLSQISCVEKKQSQDDNQILAKPQKNITVNHFLAFNFYTDINEVIRLLKSKNIKYTSPEKISKQGIELARITAFNYSIGSKVLPSVDLYFNNDSLFLVEHTKTIKEKNCYCEASVYNSDIAEVFSGLFEKYGSPTSANNVHIRFPKDRDRQIDSHYPEYDTIATHITRSSWSDWNYLDLIPGDSIGFSFSEFEVNWIGNGGITMSKKMNASLKPFKEKIDRSTRADYLPPLSKSYVDGKTYTFYNEIHESVFLISAFSQRMIELTNWNVEHSKQEEIINNRLIQDSLEKQKRKLVNEL